MGKLKALSSFFHGKGVASMVLHYTKSVVPIIELNYNELTTVEKAIGDFFIQNKIKQDFSAKNISEQLFVSEASLSRFAQKCGYKGYREFIYQYKEALGKHLKKNTAHSISILDSYQSVINNMYSLIDEKQIIRIGNFLNTSSYISALALDSSRLALQEMEMQFNKIGISINIINEKSMLCKPENTLIIAFNIDYECNNILRFLENSYENGAKTVLITSETSHDYINFCDEILILPNLKAFNYNVGVLPQLPVLIIIDMIYLYCYKNEIRGDNYEN